MYTVKDVIELLDREGLLLSAFLGSLSEDHVFSDITYDNRTASIGCLFVCKGKAFKSEYLFSAFEKGASLYVAENVIEDGFPHLTVSDIRVAMSKLAALFFADAANTPLKIGVTGTKGKTTVSVFLKAILDDYCVEQYSKRSALISSLYVDDGKRIVPSKLTTPEAIELWRYLHQASENKTPYAICEVSSQGLKYHRVSDVRFDTALFLNIGNDHISEVEHPDFEDYFSSKLKLFDCAEKACINSEADCFDRVIAYAERTGCEIFTFGFSDRDTLYCSSFYKSEAGENVSVSFLGGAVEDYTVKLSGKHNVENALAAILVAKLYQIPNENIRRGLLSANVEGRGEELVSDDGEVRVIVDYAHNGMSLEALYRYVRSTYRDAYVITVFGCPGGKAKNRRADMGRMASRYSDLVILTEDDPASETVESISREIVSYFEDPAVSYILEYDRGQAISRAFEERRGKTVILLCGKGAEKTQKRSHGEVAYAGDTEYAKREIARYHERRLVVCP